VYVVRKKQVKPEHKTTNKNMGNQGSSRGGGGPSGLGPPAADEPLESYLREKFMTNFIYFTRTQIQIFGFGFKLLVYKCLKKPVKI